ncbi:MAG TPA: AMP-binding protein [Vicinamibacterales bacterium]|nr:AMP-binding protein [Vicinamibacterales bacterium]
MRTLIAWMARAVIALRYRVEVRGLEEIRAHGRRGILFLPSHVALIDPAILMAVLDPAFHPHPLADEHQVSKPIVGWFARAFGARILPNLERRGRQAGETTRRVLEESIGLLRGGENLLFYPAGRLRHTRLEELRAASGTEIFLKAAPDARVVLVRQTGLWGSRFSRAIDGKVPDLLATLGRALKLLIVNGVFFMPRRHLLIELVEPDDLPRGASRMAINAYLEAFYNKRAPRATYVPYTFWEAGGVRELPDPQVRHFEGDAAAVPASIRAAVLDELARLSGRAVVRLEDRVAEDLGLDSLGTAALGAWIEQEFGHSAGTPESLVTAGDVVLAAAGRGISAAEVSLRPASARWRAGGSDERVRPPGGRTIPEVFLAQARLSPGAVAVADQASGEKTYRQLITGLLVLTPILRDLPGRYVGIMLPASVGAGVFYLAALFAGKTPVMVNWTTGPRNLTHALDLLGVRTVLTAGALLSKLNASGFDLSALSDRFLLAEQLRSRVSLPRKLWALVRTYASWGALRPDAAPEHAVVLFTSGSESLPKAVPLTHQNLLTNIRDVLDAIPIARRDVLIGMLPPFHSFGITVTTVLPLCAGIRVVYHPNPTEAVLLARVIETYGVTLMIGTPTFLSGIVRASSPEQLASLRLAVTGAEKCPVSVYQALGERCPDATIIEGYGITECSPIVSANRVERPVIGSIGQLLPAVEGLVVHHETGEPVAPGETGMLLVRGPSVFGGYLNYEGESPFVSAAGRTWYRTGDLVRQDADGVLWFEGRLKRFVKIGGEMIALPAIEGVLLAQLSSPEDEGPPLAVEALGPPDSPEVVVFSCRPVARDRVNAIIREAGFSPLYYVRRVIEVPAIPILGTGKTDYRTLVEREAASRLG